MMLGFRWGTSITDVRLSGQSLLVWQKGSGPLRGGPPFEKCQAILRSTCVHVRCTPVVIASGMVI